MSVNGTTSSGRAAPTEATHDLPPSALQLIADVAAQSPLVTQWLSGFLTGKDYPQGQQVRLVIDAAHVEVGNGA